ncbi:unnamed protein product, partial [Phaeothamnion confervicola]
MPRARRIAILLLASYSRDQHCAAFRLTPGARRGVVRCSATKIQGDSDKNIQAPTGTVVLAGGKARLFREGNPLVYGGAIANVLGSPAPGDVVDVIDGKKNLIGWGVFNGESMYRVRMMARRGEAAAAHRDLSKLLRMRLTSAKAARAAIGLPSPATTAYRCVNGEGDRLSGLVVDVYGDIVCVSSSALWVEVHQEAVLAAVSAVFGDGFEVVWRRSEGRLEQDGWTSGGGNGGKNGAAAATMAADGGVGAGASGEEDHEEGNDGEAAQGAAAAP